MARPTISDPTTGLPSQAKKPAATITPAHQENISRCEPSATSSIHSQSTKSAAIAQKTANGQPPKKAVSSASGASTAAETTRKARLLVGDCLPLLCDSETGSTPTTDFRTRSAQRGRQNAAHVAGILGSPIQAYFDRNQANRSERTPIHCMQPAKAGNWKGAVRRWCG